MYSGTHWGVFMRPPGPLLDGLKAFTETLPKCCQMVEVGSFAGESARVFATRAGRLWCVDPWAPYVEHDDKSDRGIQDFGTAEREFDRWQRENICFVVKLKMQSTAAAMLFADESLDVVYLDGNHEELAVRADILAWTPKVKCGGIIAGHDYGYLDFGGVKRAVDEFFGKPDEVFADSSWKVRKPEEGLVLVRGE